MYLVPIQTKSQWHCFAACAKLFYKNDNRYVPHLNTDIETIFNSEKNSHYKNGNAAAWILENTAGEIIGRIAAFYSEKQFKTGIGGIGFFECIDNIEAASLLFSTAENWLKLQGLKGTDAPINFGERDKYWGLLIQSNSEPSYQENYNPSYYQSLFEVNAYDKLFEQTTSEINFNSFKIDRFRKLSERVLSNPAYEFKHYKKSGLNQFAKDFVYIYNKAWGERPDFIPLSLESVMETLNALKPILIEEAIWFVYANQEPAGFYVNVLEVNQIFKKVNGELNLMGKLKFLYYRHFGNIDRMRGIVFGVIPAYQNLGLETGMIMKFHDAMLETKHFRRCELSWIGDFNPKMHSLFNALGAETSKIHYTYRKLWDK